MMLKHHLQNVAPQTSGCSRQERNNKVCVISQHAGLQKLIAECGGGEKHANKLTCSPLNTTQRDTQEHK